MVSFNLAVNFSYMTVQDYWTTICREKLMFKIVEEIECGLKDY